MAKFAKLFELENNEQVLLTVNYNDEEDVYDVCVQTDVEGVNIKINLSFKDKERAMEMMDSYSLEKAKYFRDDVSKIVN